MKGKGTPTVGCKPGAGVLLNKAFCMSSFWLGSWEGGAAVAWPGTA